MPASSNRFQGEMGEIPKPYRQKMSDILAPGRPEIPEEIMDQIEFAKSLGEKQGFEIMRGLGTPLSSVNWYVAAKVGKRSYAFAPGCKPCEGFDPGGFETLEEAIKCFESFNNQ